MGTLDSGGSSVKRKIDIINLTGLNISQIENQFNNNYGQKGWRIVQIITLGGTTYMVGEKEY